MAEVETNPGDSLDQFSRRVKEAGDSAKPGTSTMDDIGGSGSPSRGGDGAPFKPDDSEARRCRGPEEPDNAKGGVEDFDIIQSCKDVTCQNEDRTLDGSRNHSETLGQVVQQTEAAAEAQTDVAFRTSSRDLRANPSSKPPPAKLHEVKPEVHDTCSEEFIHDNFQVADKNHHTRPKANHMTTDTFGNILGNTTTLEAIARQAGDNIARTEQPQIDKEARIARLESDN